MEFKQRYFRKCNCYHCENDLLTLDEVKNQICNGHLDNVSKEDYFVGICWYCGNITTVESRRWDPRHKCFVIPSKYIFSKGCKSCTQDEENNIKWMTILPEGVLDAITGIQNRKELSDVAVVEITNQHNGLFTEYQN